MLLGSLLTIIVGALYILFAFVEPPETIAHFFRVPVIAIFFPPEKRMKLGRLTFGALLILMGPLLALIPAGGLARRSPILGAILAILVLGVWLAAKWKRAGEMSDARDAELRDKWQSFEVLKRDPRFVHLQHQLYAKGYRTTFERVADPSTYRVAYLALQGEKDPYLLAQHNPPARYLAAYLERDAAPKRVVASLDLQSGVSHEREAGWTDWGFVPGRPTSA
jgi:hypothetical protein